jgi:hypothetical protein
MEVLLESEEQMGRNQRKRTAKRQRPNVAVYFRWDLFEIFWRSSRFWVWTPVTTRISGFGN